MDNLIKDLQDIYSLWTYRILDKLVYDGNGTYSISKKDVDSIKATIIKPDSLDIEEKRLINSQSSRILVTLIGENLIK